MEAFCFGFTDIFFLESLLGWGLLWIFDMGAEEGAVVEEDAWGKVGVA